MTRRTRLLVTVDVERDYAPGWRTPGPATFRSVTEAIPERLAPLCAAHAVQPTYLASAEVLTDAAATRTLRSLTGCELGTHLHPEYLPPGPRPAAWSDPGLQIAAMQCELPPAVEAEQLAVLTELFRQQIGRPATSFRAGRFGAGPHTGEALANLGYAVDSSVTPGLCWRAAGGRLGPDYRALPFRPWRTGDGCNLWQAGQGRLLEVPVTIVPPAVLGRSSGDPVWFRPWYSDRTTLLAILEAAARDEDAGRPWRALTMMFHSMELVAGASPYPQTEAEVARYLDDLATVFARARELGFDSRTLGSFAAECTPAGLDSVRRQRVDPAAWTAIAPTAASARLQFAFDPLPVLEAHGVQPWFRYSLEQRHERWDLNLACSWLDENVAPGSAVLDLGCGVGFNLLWLAGRGFTDLWGCDLDAKAIAAARDLAARAGHEVRYWVDDGRHLEGVPRRTFAAVCALNWIQLAADFDLDAFMRQVSSLTADDSVLVLDYIDRSFEREPRHRWLTSDWDKPEAQRRPTEYPTRFAPEELAFALRRHGFAMEQHWCVSGPVPRGVMVARKTAAQAVLLPAVSPALAAT